MALVFVAFVAAVPAVALLAVAPVDGPAVAAVTAPGWLDQSDLDRRELASDQESSLT